MFRQHRVDIHVQKSKEMCVFLDFGGGLLFRPYRRIKMSYTRLFPRNIRLGLHRWFLESETKEGDAAQRSVRSAA